MATMVRRLEGSRVIVEFGAKLDPATGSGLKLTEWAASEDDAHLITDTEGKITGVECESKSYINFLTSIDASKDTIRAFRASLDDSKKAQRERMRR